jgi:hypothetical protein
LNQDSGNSKGNGFNEKDLFDQARKTFALGKEIMDRGDLTAAAEVLTRALILFEQLGRKDEAVAAERLLTQIVPTIGPFVYRDIRTAVEIEMGVREGETPEE